MWLVVLDHDWRSRFSFLFFLKPLFAPPAVLAPLRGALPPRPSLFDWLNWASWTSLLSFGVDGCYWFSACVALSPITLPHSFLPPTPTASSAMILRLIFIWLYFIWCSFFSSCYPLFYQFRLFFFLSHSCFIFRCPTGNDLLLLLLLLLLFYFTALSMCVCVV